VNDSYAVKSILERHADGTLNFSVVHVTSSSDEDSIKRGELKDLIEKLFKDDSEIALLYFSGHGYIENTGGYLITSECSRGDEGVSLNDVLVLANSSPAKNKIIILDSCHSGIAGTPSLIGGKALLNEGVTILTASSSTQYAMEKEDSGVFTNLLVDALNGSASNLLGDITPGSIYAHIDQSLGPWEQRPIFKTNVKSFTTLRKVQAPILLKDLKRITEFFENPHHVFQLDPSYEPTSECPDEENMEKFSILQKYNRINLVIPTIDEHMYYAAMNSTGCKLTALGVHYWNLVKKERI
jgi:hypothetical protein